MARKQEEKAVTKQVTDWDEMYPGRFMKAGQFKGRPVVLKIRTVYAEKMPDQNGVARFKGIIQFEGTDMELALNKTNGICLRAMFGRHLPGWVGKRVTFFPAPYEGDIAIRVAGSPDIPADMVVEVALARKRPIAMTMKRTVLTAKGAAPAPVPTPEPEVMEEPLDALEDPGADVGEGESADPFAAAG